MRNHSNSIVQVDNAGAESCTSIPKQILDLTGEAVLLNVRTKTKAPTEKGWPELTLGDMTNHYLGKLTANIGVSLGAPSNGLHSIDCDDDKFFEELGKLNPRFSNTLQSHGARGGNYWVRIEGDYPKNGKIRLKESDGQVGEWRSTGNQTIIHGTHPSGTRYHNNGQKVITIRFEEIQWPDSWGLPWCQANVTHPHDEETSSELTRTPPEVVEVMLMSIPPTKDRDLWMKISASVRNSLGSHATAVELLKKWAPEWKDGEYNKLLEYPFPEIGFGTLAYHAAAHGYKGVVSRFFYNGTGYAMKGSSSYFTLNEGAVKQHLSQLRVRKSSQSEILCMIRDKQHVAYIGDVAGYPSGLHQSNGKQILVTTGPNIISPIKGDDVFIQSVLRDLLYDASQPEQLECFLNWLAHCRRAVIKGRRIQSPALVMAGKRGNGKSLTIEIISRCLGGRQANGYRYLCGDTQFNKDLLGAELIVMDDPAASRDPRSRIKLAQNIKNFLFNSFVAIEGKNKDSFNCSPIQAVVFAVNDDPEHLRVLPELDEPMRDKIILTTTSPARIPSSLIGNEELIKSEIVKMLPAFLYELDRRDISAAYDDRGRFNCFWHPAITEAIGLLSNEQRLLELIHQDSDISFVITERGEWKGTAAMLEARLTDRFSNVSHNANQLLKWTGSCGNYLGKLAIIPNSGVRKAGLDSATRIQQYTITTPS
jgi:hypothetical protein